MKELFYFGCISSKGHYFWRAGEQSEGCNLRLRGVSHRLMVSIDGAFTPAEATQGKYLESTVPPLRIVAWHDYTVDSRPGSHSTLIGLEYGSAEEMLDDAAKLFPSVMNRQPRPTPV